MDVEQPNDDNEDMQQQSVREKEKLDESRLPNLFSLQRLQRQINTLGIEGLLIGETGLWVGKHGSFLTDAEQGDIGIKAHVPLNTFQIAFLQWRYHARACGWTEGPSEVTDSKLDEEACNKHTELARKWALIILAMCSKHYHSHEENINFDMLAVSLSSLGNFLSSPEDSRTADCLNDLVVLPESYKRYIQENFVALSRICSDRSSLLGSASGSREESQNSDRRSAARGAPRASGTTSRGASGAYYAKAAGWCTLAAVACGACVFAIPVLLPGVLSAATHWILAGAVALVAAGGMAQMIRSREALSWTRAVSWIAGMCMASAGACAFPLLMLPGLTAAGVPMVAAAALTLLAVGGVGCGLSFVGSAVDRRMGATGRAPTFR